MLAAITKIGALLITNLIIIACLLFVFETYLRKHNYVPRSHSWIFQNEEFIQETAYKNFSTLDSSELFIPRKNTVIVPGYWETDENGFRKNPNHTQTVYGQKVLVIGDSYAYGHGVSHEEAWPAVLEKRLNESGQRTIVYNAAVPASGSDQQFVRLSRLAKKIQPDMVIWSVSFNDMVDSNTMCLFRKSSTGYYVRFPAVANIAYINAFLTKHFPQWFVNSRVGNALTTLAIHGKDVFTIGCTQDITDAELIPIYFDKLSHFLSRVNYLAETLHFRLIILLQPSQMYLDNTRDNESYEITFLQNFVRAFRSAQVPYLDLNSEIVRLYDTSLFLARTNQTLAKLSDLDILGESFDVEDTTNSANLNYSLYIQEQFVDYGGWHLNGFGNQIIADIVFNWLKGNYRTP